MGKTVAEVNQMTEGENVGPKTAWMNPLDEIDCLNFRANQDPSVELEDLLFDVTEQNLHESICTCKPVGREVW